MMSNGQSLEYSKFTQTLYLRVHVGHNIKPWVLTLITDGLKREFPICDIAGGQFQKTPICTILFDFLPPVVLRFLLILMLY